MANREIEYGVFVSDIARGVTDEMLKEEFSKIAEVAEAIVVKNKHSGETKGYGFVKFYSTSDCHRAVEWSTPPTFKDSISGKPQSVKVTMADTKNTIYIGRIAKDLSEREVKMELEDISGCTVKLFEFDQSNRSHGWAHFKDHETTIKAIKLIQKSKYTASLTKKFGGGSGSETPSTKVLFTRGIKSQEEGDLLLKQLSSKLVDKIVVPLDNQKKTPLGHAFIYCHTIEDAREIMKRHESGVEFMGRVINLSWGQPKQKHRFMDPYAAGHLGGYPDYSYMLYPEYLSQLYQAPPLGAPGDGRGGRGGFGPIGGGRGGHHHSSYDHYSSGKGAGRQFDYSAPHYNPYSMPPPGGSVKGTYDMSYPPFYPPAASMDRNSSGGGRGGRSGYSRYAPY